MVWVSSIGNLVAQVKTDTLSQKEAEKLQKMFDKELSRTKKTNTFKVLPVVYYTPETRLAMGLVGVYSFRFNKSDTVLPFSKITPSAIYTLNKQWMLSASYDLKFNKNWFARGNFGYFIYPYFFAGIGNNHTGETLEWYGAKYPDFKTEVYRKLGNLPVHVGATYTYQNTTIDSILPNGLLDDSGVPGAQGSIISAVGIGLIYNTKDYLFSPTRGWYAELGFKLADKGIGATFSDQIFTLDVRKYVPLSKKEDVLALQVYSKFHLGNIPFNLMPLLGGGNRMRGYREGVYRDRQMIIYQAEYRSRMFFKHFGFTVFGGLGGVGNDFEEVNTNYRYTAGAGLRFVPLPSERFTVRMDYAFGERTQGFYIEVGQAF